MAYQKVEGKGRMWRNKSTHEKAPQYSGNFVYNQEELNIAVWYYKDSDSWSINVEAKEQSQAPSGGFVPDLVESENPADGIDDEIPF